MHKSEKLRLYVFFTLVTGPRRSLSLKLRDTRVYELQLRARLGTKRRRARRWCARARSGRSRRPTSSPPSSGTVFLCAGQPTSATCSIHRDAHKCDCRSGVEGSWCRVSGFAHLCEPGLPVLLCICTRHTFILSCPFVLPGGLCAPDTAYVLHGVSSSLLGPVDPSFRALSGRVKFTVRRHKFNKDSLSLSQRGVSCAEAPLPMARGRST